MKGWMWRSVIFTVVIAATLFAQHRFGIVGATLEAMHIRPILVSWGFLPPPPPVSTTRDMQANPEEVDCREILNGKHIVLIVGGQSNAGNNTPHDGVQHSYPQVYNFFNRKCWVAKDPLLGADGRGRSVWPVLGGMLVGLDPTAKVLIAPAAVNDTTVNMWSPGGIHHDLLLAALAGLLEQGFSPDYFLWLQGETDARANTPKDVYRRQLSALLESMKHNGFKGRTVIAQATTCWATSPEIREAQSSLVDGKTVFKGPNLDNLNRSLRYDKCHFSSEALGRVAEMFLESIRAAR